MFLERHAVPNSGSECGGLPETERVNLQRKWRVDVLLKFPAASGDTLEVVLQNRFRVAMLPLLESFHRCIIDPTYLLEPLDLSPGSRKGVCPSETAGDR